MEATEVVHEKKEKRKFTLSCSIDGSNDSFDKQLVES
jgi:hypothetical protein